MSCHALSCCVHVLRSAGAGVPTSRRAGAPVAEVAVQPQPRGRISQVAALPLAHAAPSRYSLSTSYKYSVSSRRMPWHVYAGMGTAPRYLTQVLPNY